MIVLQRTKVLSHVPQIHVYMNQHALWLVAAMCVIAQRGTPALTVKRVSTPADARNWAIAV